MPYNSSDYQGASYGPETTLNNEWEVLSGRCVLPVALTDAEVAAGASAVVVVRLHPEVRTHTVQFSATKTGSPPILPAADDKGEKTFLSGSYTLPHPAYHPSSGLIWSAAAEVSYVDTTAGSMATGRGFVNALPPWVTYDQTANIQTYGGGNTAGTPVAEAGIAAQAGYTSGAEDIDTSSSTYPSYDEPSYWPTSFFSADICNGGPGLNGQVLVGG